MNREFSALQGYDVIEEIYNEKTAAMNFVHELCKTRTKGNLEAFMTLCIAVMNEYQVYPRQKLRSSILSSAMLSHLHILM